jgi:peptidoglycan/xylan/chitin deacetylase (PgdA/CDA1 family)
MVYLTFDDGPSSNLTRWILQFLSEKGIRATFFCIGENVRKYPDVLEEIRASGHGIGNHSMNHEKGSRAGKSVYLNSIEETDRLVRSNLFRPPYGRLPGFLSRIVRKKHKIVMWSWLSYDYDKKVPINTIIEKANRISPGDILVLHDNPIIEDRLKELLPKLIDLLMNKGYKFGVISA